MKATENLKRELLLRKYSQSTIKTCCMSLNLFSHDYTIPFNKNGGQQNLDENRVHFSGQALTVLNTLLSGQKVSSEWGIQKQPRIFDVRARIFSLKKHGMQISEEKVDDGHGAKSWFMTPEQILFNRKLLSEK